MSKEFAINGFGNIEKNITNGSGKESDNENLKKLEYEGNSKGHCVFVRKLKQFEEYLLKTPACVKIWGPTIVIGDLHFNTGAALFVRRHYESKVKDGYNLVFLGDILDRGYQAKNGGEKKETDEKLKKRNAKWRLKTIEIVMDLKIKYPDKVTVLSGNHEIESVNEIFGFKDECITLYGKVDGKLIWEKSNMVFENLPKCAVLEQKNESGENINTFLVHGSMPYLGENANYTGIIDKMSNIENKGKFSLSNQDVANLSNSSYDPGNFYYDKLIVYDMLCNDCDCEDGVSIYNNRRDVKLVYVIRKLDLDKFKIANNIQRVISAHDHHARGYKSYNSGSYIKVISSPNMINEEPKPPGYILDINKNGKVNKIDVKELDFDILKLAGDDPNNTTTLLSEMSG